MLIRCTIEREGGTTVVMDGKAYVFEPKASGGPHVCEVNERAHIARFMAIPESYEPVVDSPAPKPAADSVSNPKPAAKKSSGKAKAAAKKPKSQPSE